jgi:hypothetical protein
MNSRLSAFLKSLSDVIAQIMPKAASDNRPDFLLAIMLMEQITLEILLTGM